VLPDPEYEEFDLSNDLHTHKEAELSFIQVLSGILLFMALIFSLFMFLEKYLMVVDPF